MAKRKTVLKKEEPAWAPPPVRRAALARRAPELLGRHEVDIKAPLSRELNLDRWLAALNAIAYFDPRRLTDSQDRPIAVRNLDDDTALGLMGVEMEEHGAETKLYVTRKYKQADRLKALELIGKHMKWLIERQEQSGPDGGPINIATVDLELQKLLQVLVERKKLV